MSQTAFHGRSFYACSQEIAELIVGSPSSACILLILRISSKNAFYASWFAFSNLFHLRMSFSWRSLFKEIFFSSSSLGTSSPCLRSCLISSSAGFFFSRLRAIGITFSGFSSPRYFRASSFIRSESLFYVPRDRASNAVAVSSPA